MPPIMIASRGETSRLCLRFAPNRHGGRPKSIGDRLCLGREGRARRGVVDTTTATVSHRVRRRQNIHLR